MAADQRLRASSRRGPRRLALAWLALGFGVAAAAPTTAAGAPPREQRLPRKVLVGTVVGGYEVYTLPLADRLVRLRSLLAALHRQTERLYPGRRLDLVVLPEYFIGHPGATLAQKTVLRSEIDAELADCARRSGCYLVVPVLLREEGAPVRFSNAAFLLDRSGQVAGVYRKVHPVAGQGSNVLEGGITPGRTFPVFDCDFGRLGIQICFDLLYADGWQALAAEGAEIVALPSASPETVHPAFYALQHGYYVVSATPRDHAAVFNPLGLIEAEVSQKGAVLVHQIDLSYEILHWDEALDEGAALQRRFGERVGYRYYRDQDAGIFWSNDPSESIGAMAGSLGLSPVDLEVDRLRKLQDARRDSVPHAR